MAPAARRWGAARRPVLGVALLLAATALAVAVLQRSPVPGSPTSTDPERAVAAQVELPSPAQGSATDAAATSTPPGARLVTCTSAGIRAEGCAVVSLVTEGGPSSPALIGQRAVVVHDGGFLVRRELPGGDVSWRVPLSDPDAAVSVLYDAGAVFVATADTTWRLDAASGSEQWSVPAGYPTPVAPELGVNGDLVELLDVAGRLTGLDREDGAERWSVPDAGRSVLGLAPRVGSLDDDTSAKGSGSAAFGAPALTLMTDGQELTARREADDLVLFRASAALVSPEPLLLARDGQVALVVFGEDGSPPPSRPLR